jgi:hypothetical protein
MGRYYTEPEAKGEAEVFTISADTIRQVQKGNSFKRSRVKALKYAKGAETGAASQEWRAKKKQKKEDPFPGRKPVDPVKIEQNSRGDKVDVKKVKTKFKQKGELVLRTCHVAHSGFIRYRIAVKNKYTV